MNIEVLSPAGNFDSLVAAVRSGADAVYIGATEFSARRNADNFDREKLISAVNYCHIRGVKVYLTLNIILKDSEIKGALSLVSFANKIGIDALIVQDLGLAALVNKHFPSLPVHASTQMSVHSAAALPILKRLGVKRVVVSREMSKDEIKTFCEEALKHNIEVEVFVHGALCMSVSGQCLLSSVLGARSGNRGLCAGPCRLPFKAENGTGYDLSLKDLSLLDEVNELKKMGVCSLKIEGRMKRPEYVSAATFAARQAVDNGNYNGETYELLKNVFSRSGFTKGYFEGKPGKEMFGIRTKEDVLSAPAAFSKLHELYRAERQSVPVSIKFNAAFDSPVVLEMSDGVNVVSVSGDFPQKAQKSPTEESAVKSSLSKLGQTPYYTENISVTLQEGIFIPVSQLNELRRKCTELLNDKRSLSDEREKTEPLFSSEDKEHKLTKIIARFRNENFVPDNLNGVWGICLPTSCDFKNLPRDKVLIADFPRYIIDENALINRAKFLKENGINYAMCGNLSSVKIAENLGFKIIGDIGLNVLNSESAKVLKNEKLSALTLSCETTLKEANILKTTLDKGIFAYGRLPLMLTRNCPLKNGNSCETCHKNGKLTDRLGVEFPVFCRNGYSEIFNSSPIYLADKLSEIKGIDFLLLSFTDETKSQAEKIINEYNTFGTPPEKFTRGLYFKGVL